VDFLDSDHVLLTFNPKKLFKRLPECPSTHSDRLMHAAVIELSSGRIVREADWYLHDMHRYTWNLGAGHILLRRLNNLYEVNANLEEKLIYSSPRDMLWVSVTPNGQQIIVETSASPVSVSSPRSGNPREPADKNPKERVQIAFLDARSLAVVRTIEVRGKTDLESTSSGFADVRKQGSNWLVEFNGTNIARVKGRKPPNLLYPSSNTVLIGRCSLSRDSYGVSTFTVTGTLLWRQHWSQCRYSALARASEDGSRAAIGTFTIREANSTTPPDASEDQEGLYEHIQVVDTATGKSVREIRGEAAVTSGQNFALSPHGEKLVVVEGHELTIYTFAEMTPEERARYLAVKADTPNLGVPPPQQNGQESAPSYESSAGVEIAEASEDKPVTSNSSPAPTLPAEAPSLTLHTGTQIVAVDVVVRDQQGRLVKGLPREAFSVSEDGKPQLMKYFREFGDEPPETKVATPPPQPLPPNIFSNSQLPEPYQAVTLVLLDVLNTPLADQERAQQELINFLKNKPKGLKFALCVLGNRLQMIQGFTADQQVLLASAKGKGGSQRHRPLQDPDSVIPASLESGLATARFVPSINFFVESVALQEAEARLVDADQRMMVTVDAFAHLARYLQGIPGRKNLVWLSGSFLLGISPDVNGQNPFLESRTYGENLKKVANLLGEAHVAVYPVNVKGLETDPLFSASSNDSLAPISMWGSVPAGAAGVAGSTRGGSARVPNPNTAIPVAVMNDALNQFSLTQTDEHETMTQLAEQTGGQAFFNTNGIPQAIQTATQQGSNYYALSYTPMSRTYDGRFRKIHVSLAGHKYHLAYRSGYFAVDPLGPVKMSKNLMSGLARAAMQQGSPASRQILFGARVVPVGKPRIVQDTSPSNPKQARKKKGKEPTEMQHYAIDNAVQFSDLLFTPTNKGTYRGVINFMVTTFDKDGTLTASEVSESVADLKPEVLQEVRAGGMRIHQEIEVPVNSVAMRIGVEDLTNSHVGTLEIPLPVPPPPGGDEGARRSLPPVEPD
ncbi:MAG TPA: VWA domain-containing protein, partial [Terriglobales bacterium]|nr:VWA domain-containing protein [Terriglobales bacterium]